MMRRSVLAAAFVASLDGRGIELDSYFEIAQK